MLLTKRARHITVLILSLMLLIFCVSASAEGTAPAYTTVASAIAQQDEVDAALLAEAELGYSFEAPLCVINPYGNVPLCAVILFDTAEETPVSMTVKGHAAENDVTAEFPAATRHILPVIGLYANEENTVVLTLADGSTSTVAVQTEMIPDETLLTGEVTVSTPGVFGPSELLFAAMGNTTCVTAYDSQGDLRYYAEFVARRTTPLRQLENGHYLVCSNNTAEADDANGGFMEVDLCGRIYAQYTLPGGFHHEIATLPNGNVLIATSQDDIAVLMDRVVEVNLATGDIVWDLDLSDIMDSTDGSGTLYREKDWAHMNAISYDEATDSVIMSCRAIDAVVSVDKAAKTLNWILGNPEGWTNTDSALFFTPAQDQADFEWNYAQHDATFMDSTHILMFDNGTNRYKTTTPEAERNTEHYSRAVLYAIDPETMTITQEWSYGKERGLEWYSSHFCSAAYNAALDAYWICSGTTQYDPHTDTYVEDAKTLEYPDDMQTLGKADLVRGSDLLFEIVLNSATYRTVCYHPYQYAAMVDLHTPGVLYTYTPAE